jgi:hypothetical protein
MQKNQEELLAMLKGKAQEKSTAHGETSRHTGAPQDPEITVPENFHTRQATEQAD